MLPFSALDMRLVCSVHVYVRLNVAFEADMPLEAAPLGPCQGLRLAVCFVTLPAQEANLEQSSVPVSTSLLSIQNKSDILRSPQQPSCGPSDSLRTTRASLLLSPFRAEYRPIHFGSNAHS
jgi:hypothetical protein